MTGYLLDDPMFLVEDKDRKEKVNQVFSDVEQLQKEPKLSDRYMYIVQLTICTYLWGSTLSRSSSYWLSTCFCKVLCVNWYMYMSHVLILILGFKFSWRVGQTQHRCKYVLYTCKKDGGLAPFVQRLDNAIHWISVNKANHSICWTVIFLVDSVIHNLNNQGLMVRVQDSISGCLCFVFVGIIASCQDTTLAVPLSCQLCTVNGYQQIWCWGKMINMCEFTFSITVYSLYKSIVPEFCYNSLIYIL